MKKIYKQLNISKDDPDLIAVATETRSNSVKSIGNKIFYSIFFLMGIIWVFLFFYSFTLFPNVIGEEGLWDTVLFIFGIVLLLITSGGSSVFFLGVGYVGLRSKSEWYLALFKDRLLIHILNEESRKYEEKIFPLKSIQKCILLKMESLQFVTIKNRSYESISYPLSLHIKCNQEEEEYIHLRRIDKVTGLNKALKYLQDEKGIPIYYTFAPGEQYDYNTRYEENLIHEFPQELITFDGDIEQYKEKEKLRRVNIFTALEKSKPKKKEDKTREENL